MGKTLVIGGNGFIGLHIVSELLHRNRDVRILGLGSYCPVAAEFISGDYMDKFVLEAALDGVDAVYQLAGKLGTSELAERDTVMEAEMTNVQGHLQVLEECAKRKIQDIFFPTKPNEWCNTYSITKQAAERYSQMYSLWHGLHVRMLRYVDVFGAGQRMYPIRKAVPIFCFQALRGLTMEIFGSGEQNIELLYAPDAAKTTVDFMELPWRKEFLKSLDCGCGAKMSVNELVTLIRDQVETWMPPKRLKRSKVVHLPMRSGQGGEWGAVENVWKYTQFPHSTILSSAIRDTLAYYDRIDPVKERELFMDLYEKEQPGPDDLTEVGQWCRDNLSEEHLRSSTMAAAL